MTVEKAATGLHIKLTKLVVVVPLPLQYVVVAEQVGVQEVVVAPVGVAQITSQSVTVLLTLKSSSPELVVGTVFVPIVMVANLEKGEASVGGISRGFQRLLFELDYELTHTRSSHALHYDSSMIESRRAKQAARSTSDERMLTGWMRSIACIKYGVRSEGPE